MMDSEDDGSHDVHRTVLVLVRRDGCSREPNQLQPAVIGHGIVADMALKASDSMPRAT
jgi:hypothetical protein